MSIFDLVFIVLCLAFAGTSIRVLYLALRGKRDGAIRTGRALVQATAAYLAIVAVVGLVSPQRIVAIGADKCSDDWCIAVDSVTHGPDGAQIRYIVSIRVSSRARRIVQREHGVVVYLRDAAGQRFDPLPDPKAVPFDTLLHPGESIRAPRQFVVPVQATDLAMVVTREGVFPGCCIIGDENSLLHKRTIVRVN